MLYFRTLTRSLILLGPLFFLGGCSLHSPKIEVVCNELGLGYFQLVWETTPTINGKVKIYISDSPTQFKRIYPDRECDIEENTTSFFLPDSYTRKYFLLVFNNKEEIIVSNRVIKFDGIANFRDIGGYETTAGAHIRWGMLYRSGVISSLSRNTQVRLANLRPYTVINLQDRHPMIDESIEFPNIQVVNLPITGVDIESISERITHNEFKRGDAALFIQDRYRAYVDNNHSSLYELFEILSNPQNYPIIIEGEYGKDRVSVVIALILHLLGIEEETIIDDYLLSNENLTYLFKLDKSLADLNPETQEAITMLHQSNANTIIDLFDYLNQRYGSIDHFLEVELKIDKFKSNSIRTILLNEKQ